MLCWSVVDMPEIIDGYSASSSITRMLTVRGVLGLMRHRRQLAFDLLGEHMSQD